MWKGEGEEGGGEEPGEEPGEEGGEEKTVRQTWYSVAGRR